MTEPVLEVKNLKKYFKVGKKQLKAVDDVSFSVNKGEIIGIVGESGCGKTTCGRTAIGLYPKTDGTCLYKGRDLHAMKGDERCAFCCEVQTVFQDPYGSLDSKNRVIDQIAEGLDIHKKCDATEREDRVAELMKLVGLNPSWMTRLPGEFSGGMRQRIGIARALALDPELLLCDEPISALDVSIQAQIVNLLMELRDEKGLTYLFISHDLSMVKHISDRILVMYMGQVVEECAAKELYDNPAHPYTKALISAIPIPDPKIEKTRQRIVLQGQVPSPIDPPAGCRFAGRCPFAKEECKASSPALKEVAPGHFVSCHFA